MWFPGTDTRITTDVPWETGPLTLPNLTEWLYPTTITIPSEAERHIRCERVKTMHGETGALDGHAIFCREKFAYGLAVIDGRGRNDIRGLGFVGNRRGSIGVHPRRHHRRITCNRRH